MRGAASDHVLKFARAALFEPSAAGNGKAKVGRNEEYRLLELHIGAPAHAMERVNKIVDEFSFAQVEPDLKRQQLKQEMKMIAW